MCFPLLDSLWILTWMLCKNSPTQICVFWDLARDKNYNWFKIKKSLSAELFLFIMSSSCCFLSCLMSRTEVAASSTSNDNWRALDHSRCTCATRQTQSQTLPCFCLSAHALAHAKTSMGMGVQHMSISPSETSTRVKHLFAIMHLAPTKKIFA